MMAVLLYRLLRRVQCISARQQKIFPMTEYHNSNTPSTYIFSAI